MDPLVLTYLAYLSFTVPITLWVGTTLKSNGRVFLMDVFDADEELADAVNRLLVVGFYLVNLGYVLVALKTTNTVDDLRSALEVLSMKVGTIVLVLGVLHFVNLIVLNRLRRRSQTSTAAIGRPPVAPDLSWSPPGVPA